MPSAADPIAPSPEDSALAKESSRRLAPLATAEHPEITVQVPSKSRGKKTETISLPRGAVQLLIQLLTEMSKGNAVTLMPIHAQLTTQQAAELLGVSRPFIIKEIREKKIPYLSVGTHRRIRFADLMAYKRRCVDTHNQAMNELVQQAQELKLGY